MSELVTCSGSENRLTNYMLCGYQNRAPEKRHQARHRCRTAFNKITKPRLGRYGRKVSPALARKGWVGNFCDGFLQRWCSYGALNRILNTTFDLSGTPLVNVTVTGSDTRLENERVRVMNPL